MHRFPWMGASHPKGMLGAGHRLRLARIGTCVDKLSSGLPEVADTLAASGQFAGVSVPGTGAGRSVEARLWGVGSLSHRLPIWDHAAPDAPLQLRRKRATLPTSRPI